MSVIAPESRIVNIKRSLFTYIKIFAAAHDYTVYYEHAGRSGTLPQSWLEVTLLPGASVSPLRPAGDGMVVSQIEFYLNINCFERDSSGVSTQNIYGLASTVDAVRERFAIGTGVPIYDYATSGNPQVGALMIWEMPSINVIPTASDAGLRQLNVSVPFRYDETVTIS